MRPTTKPHRLSKAQQQIVDELKTGGVIFWDKWRPSCKLRTIAFGDTHAFRSISAASVDILLDLKIIEQVVLPESQRPVGHSVLTYKLTEAGSR